MPTAADSGSARTLRMKNAEGKSGRDDRRTRKPSAPTPQEPVIPPRIRDVERFKGVGGAPGGVIRKKSTAGVRGAPEKDVSYLVVFDGSEPLGVASLGAARERAKEAPPAVAESAPEPLRDVFSEG